MIIKINHGNIPLIYFEKKSPNSSVSGDNENFTYILKCHRLEKTIAFSFEDINNIYNFIKQNWAEILSKTNQNYQLIRDNGDHILLNFAEMCQFYYELLFLENDFI